LRYLPGNAVSGIIDTFFNLQAVAVPRPSTVEP
jgi:hypothetical protein